MQHCRHYYNIVLLLVLLVAGPVLSAPGFSTDSCRDETAELNRNHFGIVEQVGDLDLWTDKMRSDPESVCTKQSDTKTTCILDYVNATDSSEWCLNIPDTIYVETTFIYRCDIDDTKEHIFYSVKNRPACYSSVCYDGYDMRILEDLEFATFDELAAELKNPNTDSEWGSIKGFDTCETIRLEVTDPIISEAVGLPGNPTASPTVSPAPTTTVAPSDAPSVSPAPTNSPAPTEVPREWTCKDESNFLVSQGMPVTTMGAQDGSNSNKIAEGLSNIQNLMAIDINTGKGFEERCVTITDGSMDNVTALCEFDYDAVIEFTSQSEDSIAALCHDANGIYVEDSVSITCTSLEEEATDTRLVIRNKPSCRSKLCNADGVREVATTEFDRWMKLVLDEGIQEAFAKNGNADAAPILTGPQICVIDREEYEDADEGVVVAVGGVALSNIEGEPIKPTDECKAYTDLVDGNIEVYNQKAVFQRAILDYVDTDLRQICGSPEPDVLECNWDWSEIFEPSDEESADEAVAEKRNADGEALKAACMPDGSGSSGAGQYVESTFQTYCENNEGKSLTMTSTNVPACVGRPCTPGQAEYIFDDDYTFLADYFFKEGWSCSTEVLSVFAPHYDPYFGTYDMTEIVSNPQYDSIVVEDGVNMTSIIIEDDEDSGVVDIADNEGSNTVIVDEDSDTDLGDNAIVVDAPTEAPTEQSSLHLRGPQYGNLFIKPQDPGGPIYLGSSSPSTFSGETTTLLLLIPAALSMLLM